MRGVGRAVRGVLEFWRWLIGGTLTVCAVLLGPGLLVWQLTGERWTFYVLSGLELLAVITVAVWED